MDNLPKDVILYNKVKKYIYEKYPKHSAYRSGILVKEYKKAYNKKYGNNQSYTWKKTEKKGLSRWFKEEWKNQRGEIGYNKNIDIYRPTKRVTKETPLTFSELSKYEIRRAQNEKKNKGRIYKFRKKKLIIFV